MTLPPLPAPHATSFYANPLFTDDQMRAYGEACAAAERESLRDDAAALLRELLAEPVINHKMTTEPAEPQGEPAMAAEIEGDCLVAWNASAYGHSKADTVHPMFLTAFTLGYRAAENATHPPQQRQPLTDYEIDRFWMNRPNLHDGELLPQLRDFARAIERAHGIGEAP